MAYLLLDTEHQDYDLRMQQAISIQKSVLPQNLVSTQLRRDGKQRIVKVAGGTEQHLRDLVYHNNTEDIDNLIDDRTSCILDASMIVDDFLALLDTEVWQDYRQESF